MLQLDRLVGLSMLVAATTIFVYYTVWTLFMVGSLVYYTPPLPCRRFSLVEPANTIH